MSTQHYVYFATNRLPKVDLQTGRVTDFTAKPSMPAGLNLRYGRAVVALDNSDEAKVTFEVAPEQLFANADADKAEGLRGSDDVLKDVQKTLQREKKDVLVILHGYRTSFEDGLINAAVIDRALSSEYTIFAFCWPSQDDALSYHTDCDYAELSGKAMARVLQRVVDFMREINDGDRCERNIHLLAHSMGNQVLRWTIQAGRETYRNHLPPILDQVILTAADEDSDAFEYDEKLKLLPRMCRNITIYHTPLDLALVVSDHTKGNSPRLGAYGPDNTTKVNDRVAVVDVTEVVRGDGSTIDHNYHRDNPYVIKDLKAALEGADSFPSRKPQALQQRWKLAATTTRRTRGKA